MPELPEVETTRRGILPALKGRRIQAVNVREPRLRWRVAADFAAALPGQRVMDVRRRAKYLLIVLERGAVIWHLGMSGSLRVLTADTALLPHDHLDILLDSGLRLRFNDPRRFGSVHYTIEDPAQHFLLRELGPEPLDAELNGAYLARKAKGRSVAVKQFLMNSRVVVGVGNIYASEALFRAGIRPQRAAGRVPRAAFDKLAQSTKDVLNEAIKSGGTTLRDYVDPDGMPGYFRQKLFVYERAGEPCRLCRTAIKQIVQGQRSTYFCASCQR